MQFESNCMYYNIFEVIRACSLCELFTTLWVSCNNKFVQIAQHKK